jgi:hypothetical protein
MERLWSPAGATSGKYRQIGLAAKPLKQAQIGCHTLRLVGAGVKW